MDKGHKNGVQTEVNIWQHFPFLVTKRLSWIKPIPYSTVETCNSYKCSPLILAKNWSTDGLAMKQKKAWTTSSAIFFFMASRKMKFPLHHRRTKRTSFERSQNYNEGWIEKVHSFGHNNLTFFGEGRFSRKSGSVYFNTLREQKKFTYRMSLAQIFMLISSTYEFHT